ncbi:prephenate dehydrogenase [Halanaerobiaceae bacterium Z-7014]|uniref:Prephenate dehydrogenase n=1 Tax=Halonatronomonas betaini TaxID=2778430 RepID=A0A931F607_9FIRM|nr:prephenate dehydrogenase [Halonatronomonas betaini]MBF8436405.1 prephenate dehydrogenase [Halonatronomonas betaini]
MEFNIKNILIIGTGLIGASLAGAIKTNYPEIKITGIDKDRNNLDYSLKNNLIDFSTKNLNDLELDEYQLIILATPVNIIKEYLNRLYPLLKGQTSSKIIIDTGSTKAEIVKQGSKLNNLKNTWFLGGHPMAGLEQSGARYSQSNLFTEKPFIITRSADTSYPETIINRLKEFLKGLKMNIIELEPESHDQYLAGVSHLSQLLAYILAEIIADEENSSEMLAISGNGYKDMTRLASSSKELWEEIFKSNSENLIYFIDKYIARLNQYQDWLKESEENLKDV